MALQCGDERRHGFREHGNLLRAQREEPRIFSGAGNGAEQQHGAPKKAMYACEGAPMSNYIHGDGRKAPLPARVKEHRAKVNEAGRTR